MTAASKAERVRRAVNVVQELVDENARLQAEIDRLRAVEREHNDVLSLIDRALGAGRQSRTIDASWVVT